MTHHTTSARTLAQTRRWVSVALPVLTVPALLAAPAAAEPQPWHNPEYVAEAPTTQGLCDQPARDKTGASSRSTRSRCPFRTTVTSQQQPNKSQIEYQERLAMAAPNKSQIEYQERLAMAAPNKSQIEYQERLAMSGMR